MTTCVSVLLAFLARLVPFQLSDVPRCRAPMEALVKR